MAGKTTKQDNATFESTAAAQWNLNRNRFLFTQNAIMEIARLFGLTISMEDGSFVAYNPQEAKLQLSSIHSSDPLPEQQKPIDIDVLGQAITEGLSGKFKEYLKLHSVEQEPLKASVDDSVHIANNKALMDKFKEYWMVTFEEVLSQTLILKEINEDSSIVYKVDKAGHRQRLVDQEEKAKIEFEKRPKFVKFLKRQINSVRKVILFYAMAFVILLMLIWNVCLQQENRELELTKKEYLILRWHANTKPDSKIFMEQLDSFVKAEGVSPVYDRVVEQLKTQQKQQNNNNNTNIKY